jgi:hypothetical protein
MYTIATRNTLPMLQPRGRRVQFARIPIVVRSPSLAALTEQSSLWSSFVVRSFFWAADRPYPYAFMMTKAIPGSTTSTIIKPLLSSLYANIHPQPKYVFLKNGLNAKLDLYHPLKALDKDVISLFHHHYHEAVPDYSTSFPVSPGGNNA